MARSRNIKPGIMANELLGELPPIERLLFIYLWMLADREGRLEDRPKRIKVEALPYDDVDADAILSKLQKMGFILRYSVDSKRIIQVVKFAQHQAPHVREKASTLPKHDPETTEVEPCTEKALPEHCQGSAMASPSHSDSLIPDSLIPDSLLCAEPAQAPANPLIDSFAQFWDVYPKRRDKAKALKAWYKLKPDQLLVEKILDAVKRQAASTDWARNNGQYVPLPTTWLNGCRWEDEILAGGNVHAFPGQARHTGFEKRKYTDGLGAQRMDGSYEI